ncbi:succinate dehydrogenase, cytochrome b556 subunit [Lutibaculum baratangense]|uniref:Succinate dehydrogenase cytochrome b556 subunit n=1 Tax=Lutibaculum baratangense AMV1 TaxID=631454 RepID=V4RKA8_9HYPH|nr:succinate dehydrogenase, cytochrome b556 subunit [Lutibaculum baratangense]ESR26476.1 Succinate dehydrogenase cytochrome b-556 subunit [Lutibaculum baratangense AMV1]
MATPALEQKRPLSPHLSVFRPIITMVMSIVHRITGAALYFGTLLLVVWLVAAASGPEAFETVHGLYGSILGRIVLALYTWTLIHHMLGGIRHLIWDFQLAMDPPNASRLAWATIIGSVTLTILIWIAAYIVM